LGEGADLIVDNGQSLRALPASEIARAAQGIADWLATRSSDIICLQENAEAGFLTRKVPLRSIIEQALPDRQNIFWSDMKSVIAPALLRLNHGMSVHTRVKLGEIRAKLFPQDDTYHLGLLKKHYGALISRSRISNTGFEWVVFNIHLSAFDERGHARRKQLQKLLSLAQQAYEAGHFVVIAGDWNMRLAPTDFPHQTAEKDLFWVTDFPQDSPPTGWQIVVDEGRPTVRTLNTAYRARETYTTIVDGFVISPNVELKHVSTTDNGFEFADHHPVEAKFVART
jgi:endonuclease/exonuclease/phosphatase family metal-dependent hydrolase